MESMVKVEEENQLPESMITQDSERWSFEITETPSLEEISKRFSFADMAQYASSYSVRQVLISQRKSPINLSLIRNFFDHP